MTNVKCAIVGVGNIGAQHGDWMQTTGSMDVAAICDPNAEFRAKAAEKFPKAKQYADLADMLAAGGLDFAVIAIPHNAHTAATNACLEAGLDVMVEKPMATRYEDCLSMIATAKKCKRLLTVFHNRRLDPWYVEAQKVIDSGRLGTLAEIRAQCLNPAYFKTRGTWRSFRETSGGLMYDWGAHLIDHVLHFAGSRQHDAAGSIGASPIVSVAAMLYRRPHIDPALNDDHGHIIIRFASGAIGRVIISDIDREPKNRFTIIGEDATMVDGWNFGGGALKIYSGDGRTPPYTEEDVPYGTDKASATTFYAKLAAHYQDGAPIMVTPESAARVIRVLNAADQSSSQGGAPIPFNE